MPEGGGGPPMPPGNEAPPEGAEGQGRKATPEEQHTHDEFISNAVNALYQKGTVKSVMTMMEATKFTPAKTLANVASMIVGSVLASAEGNKMQVAPPIVAKAAAKVISEISTEMLPAANMPAIEPDVMKAALAHSMEVLRDERAAPAPPEGEGASPAPGLAPPGPGGNGMMPVRLADPRRFSRRKTCPDSEGVSWAAH